MSGAFEVAAGAFAVIGAADIAVRTGREVHGFLVNVADAPDEINRLCEHIEETTLLAEKSQECLSIGRLKKPATTCGATAALDASLRGLNRGLQSLKVLSLKFRGTRNSWSRVRYVLDEREVGKALTNLERSKTLLANALVMACRELSTHDDQDVLHLVRCCFEQAGLRQDALGRTLTMKLEDYQDMLASRLAVQNQQSLQKHDAHQEALVSVHRTQTGILSRQACLARTSTRIPRQTSSITKTFAETQHKVKEEHQKTRDILSTRMEDIISAKLEELHIPLARYCSNREVFFFGERRDMIMAYLLLAQSQLEIVIQHLSLQTAGDQHIAWLQFEVQNLVASAAQEAAASHVRSTATPLDQWFYSEDVFRSRARATTHKTDNPKVNTSIAKIETDVATHLSISKRPNSTQQTFFHNTSFGALRVHVPRQVETPKDVHVSNEVGFNLTCGIGQSVHAISARFFRNMGRGSGPKLCAQLNVFTLAESYNHYDNLFAHGSVGDIDTALRQGDISPYHINREGINLCLYYAAEHTRSDLFDYLDSQGIGVSSLKYVDSPEHYVVVTLTGSSHDSSIVAGLIKRLIMDNDRPKLEASVDHVLDKVYDLSAFLSEMTTVMLLWDYYRMRPRSISKKHWRKLQKEGLVEYSPLTSSTSLDDSPWDWESVSSLIHPLYVTGADVYSIDSLGRNRFQRCFCRVLWNDIPGDPQAVEEIVGAWIRAGVRIHHRDNEGLTSSMYARRSGIWQEWCRALERNGMCIDDVVAEEHAEWLKDEDWRETWKEKYGQL